MTRISRIASDHKKLQVAEIFRILSTHMIGKEGKPLQDLVGQKVSKRQRVSIKQHPQRRTMDAKVGAPRGVLTVGALRGVLCVLLRPLVKGVFATPCMTGAIHASSLPRRR